MNRGIENGCDRGFFAAASRVVFAQLYAKISRTNESVIY